MPAPLYTEDDVLMYHSRSRDAPPGQGAGEQVSVGDYTELAAIPDWRRLLSNFAASPFALDGLRWQSVEHFFQAQKFRTKAPEHYRSFALDSGSALSADLGGAVKRAGGRRAMPLTAAERAQWETVKLQEMERALTAKYTQSAPHRAALLATGLAKLTHKPARARYARVEVELMRVRQALR